ncbi:MAG TPA: hypothetical protein V6D19_22815 [Stenomitos sp.]
MNKATFSFLLLPVMASLAAGAIPAQAAWQTTEPTVVAQWGGGPSYRVQNILDSLVYHVDTFQRSYDRSLDNSRLDGTQREDNLNARVRDFQYAARDLRNDYEDGDAGRRRLRDLLDQGWRLQNSLERSPQKWRWRDEWYVVRQDLTALNDWLGGRSFNRSYRPYNPNRSNRPFF